MDINFNLGQSHSPDFQGLRGRWLGSVSNIPLTGPCPRDRATDSGWL